MCCGSPLFLDGGERAWVRQEYTTIDGRISGGGISAFGADISFPGTTPYALHTRIPSMVSSIFEILLTPSILQVTIGGFVIDSQRGDTYGSHSTGRKNSLNHLRELLDIDARV